MEIFFAAGKSIKAKCCLLLGFARFFFIWVASGNNESSLSREFLGNEKTLRPAKWLTQESKREKNRGVHWLVITLLPSDKTEMYKIQALP